MTWRTYEENLPIGFKCIAETKLNSQFSFSEENNFIITDKQIKTQLKNKKLASLKSENNQF